MPRRALFIGRFQPFHGGHVWMVHRGIGEEYDEVILGMGSSQYGHRPRNPFTAEERQEMIRRVHAARGLGAHIVIEIPDIGDDDQWVDHVLSLVPSFAVVVSHDPLTRRLFEEAGYEILDPPLWRREKYSGTQIRSRMVEGGDWKEGLTPEVAAYLEEIDAVHRVRTLASRQRDDEE